jgi:ParB-like chromosome segregation protein Spo0J
MSRSEIVEQCRAVFAKLADLEEQDRIDAINEIRLELHSVSPMAGEPVDCVLWVRAEEVTANDYNPNSVAPPEMDLLRLSIEADGYTQPIVTFPEGPTRTIVDGFHRSRVGREFPAVSARIKGRLPVTSIRPDREERNNRIAATIRHNRARGKHDVEAMSQIVMELTRRNWSEQKIAKELGMGPDEVLRLRQITGLAEMFAHREFSEAWEAAPMKG